MSKKDIQISPSKFKNTALVIIDKSNIVFVNSKAKKILCIKKNNEKNIHSLLYSIVKKKPDTLKLNCNNKTIVIKLCIENIIMENEEKYCIVFEDITKQTQEVESLNTQVTLFEKIFEKLPVGIFLHDYGKLKYANKAAKQIMGTSDKKKYINYDLLKFLYIPKEKERAIERIKQVYTGKKLPSTVYHIRNFKNEEKIIVLSTLLFNTKDKPLSLLIVQDKTEEINKQQIEIESQLKHQENKILKKQNLIKERLLNELELKRDQLFNTINYSDYLFCIFDENLKLVLFNQTFYSYVLKYYGVKVKTNADGRNLLTMLNKISPSSSEERIKAVTKVLQEKKEYQYEIRNYDVEIKKERIYKILLKPTLDKNKKIKSIYCYGHEITEKYEFLNQIENQSIKLNTIIENSPIYLWSMNANQEITLFNTNYKKIIEKVYVEKPIVGKKISRTKYSYNNEITKSLEYHYQKAFSGSNENFKLDFTIDENKKITLDVNLFPIVVNNKISEIAGVATDITMEIEKQKQLENLLHENEILMKEIHHRIKNNLQVISSMINLQIENEQNTHIKNILRETQNRIHSMSMIHQTLYQNKNYSSINIANIILILAQNILYSFNRTDIEIQPELEDIILDVNTAVPLALIVNECITNVSKYAFPQNYEKEKKLFIQLKRTDHSIKLIIKDTGIGIKQKNIEDITNVGYTIIRALTEQINAKLSVISKENQGTEIQLLIPQI